MQNIRENGTEIERCYEAVHRNLIAEKIIHSQLERKIQITERLRNSEKRDYEKLKRKYDEDHTFFNKQQILSRYEFVSA